MRRVVWSGSTLFAKVYVLVCKGESVEYSDFVITLVYRNKQAS